MFFGRLRGLIQGQPWCLIDDLQGAFFGGARRCANSLDVGITVTYRVGVIAGLWQSSSVPDDNHYLRKMFRGSFIQMKGGMFLFTLHMSITKIFLKDSKIIKSHLLFDLRLVLFPKRTEVSFRVTDKTFVHPSFTAMRTNRIKWHSPEVTTSKEEERWGGGNLSSITTRHCDEKRGYLKCLSKDGRQSPPPSPNLPPYPRLKCTCIPDSERDWLLATANPSTSQPGTRNIPFFSSDYRFSGSVLTCSQRGAVVSCDSQPFNQVLYLGNTKPLHR